MYLGIISRIRIITEKSTKCKSLELVEVIYIIIILVGMKDNKENKIMRRRLVN